MKISIIIPMYNVEKYLERCLISINNQTYKNLEIILINDGSTDKTLSIAQEYTKKNNKYKIFSQENKGPSEARNVGINLATGEYISFLDADDALYDNYFEIIVKNLSYDIDVLGFLYDEVNDKFKPSSYIKKINSQNINNDSLQKWKFKNNNLYSTCRYVYSKKIIGDTLFPTDCINAEDQKFNYEIFKKVEKIKFLKNKLYLYFQHESSTSLSNLKSIEKNKKELEIRKYFILDEKSENKKIASIHYMKGVIALALKGGDMKGILTKSEKFQFIFSIDTPLKYKIGLLILVLRGKI